MKKIITSIIICLTSYAAMAQEKSAASLKEAELNRFKIMIAQDGAGLDKILHNDLVYVHSSGTKDNKASYIQSIVSKKTIYHKMDVIELTQRIYGNIGINNGIVHVINLKDGVEQPANKLIFTDIYVFENGRWQMVSWQSTKLPVQEVGREKREERCFDKLSKRRRAELKTKKTVNLVLKTPGARFSYNELEI
jgi:hypothetical protein